MSDFYIEYTGYVPSVNNMYLQGKGYIYLNPYVRNFEDNLRWMFYEKYKKINSDKRFGAFIKVGGLRKGRDIQNITKAIFDAFQGFAYKNDSQIDDYRVKRIKDKILIIYLYEM